MGQKNAQSGRIMEKTVSIVTISHPDGLGRNSIHLLLTDMILIWIIWKEIKPYS